MSTNVIQNSDSNQLSVNDIKSDLSLTPVQRLISSCVGASVTALCVTPLDVVKTRLQSQQQEVVKSGQRVATSCDPFRCPGGQTLPTNRLNGHFGETFKMFIKISGTEGPTALWSGLPATLVMVIPGMGVYFTTYDVMRVYLNQRFQLAEQPLWVPVVAGGLARTLTATMMSPLEMIKTKMQSKHLSYKDMGRALNTLVKTQGVRSLWRGLNATILRDAPFSSIYWANYEFMKKQLKSSVEPTFGVSFICGATSGVVAALVTHPFDLVKTHRQIDLGEIQKLTNSSPKTGVILLKIYRESGVKGLFVGIVPRLIRVAPACAIMISIFEVGKSYFREYNESKVQ